MPQSADVVVAGAGIGGLAAAIELSKCGRSVVLVDSHQVGFGASSRNMGLLSGVAKESEAWLLHLLDDAKAECDLDTGAMLLAPTARNLRHLAASLARRKQQYGLEDHIVTGGQLHAHIGGRASEEFAGALMMPDAKHLNPGKMIVALARYAQSLGVRVCEHTELVGWRREGNGLSLSCGGEEVAANELLLATGGYGEMLSQPLWKRTLAIPSTAAVSEALPVEVIEAMLPSACLAVMNRYRGYNCRLSPDRTRILLAGPVAVAPRTTADDLANLQNYFEKLFPPLRGVEFTHCWTGYAGAARDREVHIGKCDGAWYSIGASGLVYSADAGRRAANLIASGQGVSDEDFSVWPLRANQELLWSSIAMTARMLDVLRCSRQR